MDPSPQLKEHCPSVTEAQSTPEMNVARRQPCEFILFQFTPTWVPSSSCLCPSVVGGGGGGRCPHRRRQSADPAHLIKPTHSLVIPASWGKPCTHTNPRGWAAPNLILHCECKVSDFSHPAFSKNPIKPGQNSFAFRF